MLRPLLLAALLCGAATPLAAQPKPGGKRTGSVEVTVSYSGAGGWERAPQSQKHQYNRSFTYRAPLVGYYNGASGWKEIDSKLPPVIEGPIPESRMTSADVADLTASVEAAEARCGEDEACLMAALMPKAQSLKAAGKLEVPKVMPKGNAPDFTRFVIFSPDCATATASLTVADKHQDVMIEASEGNSGLRRRDYTVGGTRTVRGESMAHCRMNAALDTKTGKISVHVPIDVRMDATASDNPKDKWPIDFAGTGGTAALRQRLEAKLRWLEVPAGKTASGRRVLENVNEATGEATPIRATVEWKISIDG
ncbi:hypothetical protein ACFOMD_01115 [Sphingoaurantiacus capsulatus]|uniref:DUF4384 domain-containing protein n=1 Tax=Sphingoaurantiacus capsulatus TaxID=1771310 RepID=A0ABV7X4R5_9SPHN